MFKIAFLLSAIVAVALARVRSCDRGVLGPDPSSVRITGCDNNSVCRIVRGSNIQGSMDFTAGKFRIFLKKSFQILIKTFPISNSQRRCFPWAWNHCLRIRCSSSLRASWRSPKRLRMDQRNFLSTWPRRICDLQLDDADCRGISFDKSWHWSQTVWQF